MKVPGTPPRRSFWAASAAGTGSPTLTWPTKSGHWSVVVMNADGSPGIDAQVTAGANLPYAIWFGIGFAAFGVLLLGGAAAMVYAGSRRTGPPPAINAEQPRPRPADRSQGA
jgi:hypothetical protein